VREEDDGESLTDKDDEGQEDVREEEGDMMQGIDEHQTHEDSVEDTPTQAGARYSLAFKYNELIDLVIR
jgi:hypothetical protein